MPGRYTIRRMNTLLRSTPNITTKSTVLRELFNTPESDSWKIHPEVATNAAKMTPGMRDVQLSDLPSVSEISVTTVLRCFSSSSLNGVPSSLFSICATPMLLPALSVTGMHSTDRLYTSDAADEERGVDLGGGRVIQ